MKHFTLVCCIALACTFVQAQTVDFSNVQTALEKEVDALKLSHDLRKLELRKKYKNALDALYESARTQGNLTLITEIRVETNRMTKDFDVPDIFSGEEPLNNLQGVLDEQMTLLKRQFHQSMATLLTDTHKNWGRLQQYYVRQDLIEDAIKVEKARKALLTRLEYTEASRWLKANPLPKQNDIQQAHQPHVAYVWDYLADMELTDSAVGHGQLSLGHRHGMNNDHKLAADGKEVTKGVFMHPPQNGIAFAEFNLGRKKSFFKASVSIDDSGVRGTATPVIFKVIGDGKVLWESDPIGKNSKPQAVDVQLPLTRELRLEVECPGSAFGAHALWIDPQVR